MAILEDASVQYGDMKGTVALDWHEGGGGHNFAAECAGIDLTRYFPLALTMFVGVDVSSSEHFLSLTFYAADKSVVGESGESICRYATEHDGKIPTERFEGKATLEQFTKHMKRFEVVLRPQRGFENITIEYEST